MPSNLGLVAPLPMLLVLQVCYGLRMINLDAPQIALEGYTIQLSCFFKLNQPSGQTTTATTTAAAAAAPSSLATQLSAAGQTDLAADGTTSGDAELLYAIKWYKDGREFYRYLAQEWPRKQWLPMDGVTVDVDKSDNHTVVLRAVALKTSGLFRCEVSTDRPHFVTKSIERRLLVYAIPNVGPKIETIKPADSRKPLKLFLGDSVDLTCSSPESKPPMILDWMINDSLNLSSLGASSGLAANPAGGRFSASPLRRELFNISTSRIVRLPNLGAANAPDGSRPSARLAYSNSSSSSSSFGGTFLIQNETGAGHVMAVREGGAGESRKLAAINLTGSLDRVAEMSATRLSFNVDANLFLHLGRSPLRPSAGNSSGSGSSSSSTLARSRGIRGAPGVGRSMQQHSPANNKAPSSAAPTKAANLSAQSNSISSTGGVAGRTDSATVGAHRKRPAKLFYNDAGELLLRVKCVARLLHFTMSDEIKLILVDRAQEDERELSTAEKRRSNLEAVPKSGCPSSRSTNFRLYFITVIFQILVARLITVQFGILFSWPSRRIVPNLNHRLIA